MRKNEGQMCVFALENIDLRSNIAMFVVLRAVLKTLFHGVCQKSAARP